MLVLKEENKELKSKEVMIREEVNDCNSHGEELEILDQKATYVDSCDP